MGTATSSSGGTTNPAVPAAAPLLPLTEAQRQRAAANKAAALERKRARDAEQRGAALAQHSSSREAMAGEPS